MKEGKQEVEVADVVDVEVEVVDVEDRSERKRQ